MTGRRFILPPEIRYTLVLFFGTRVALTVIGVMARSILAPVLRATSFVHPDWVGTYRAHRPLLDIWGVADTGWYLDIANHGYSALKHDFGQANYVFFPLYPSLMRALGAAMGDPYVAGIIISNVSLIIACIVLYKLVLLETDGDVDTGLNSVKYLLLYPAGFVFSGVLSESLYLALLLSCFYFAKRQDWRAAGILGFCLSLARPIGVFAFFPLLYEYGPTAAWKLKRLRIDVGYLLLIPSGFMIFTAYQALLTGDVLAFVHTSGRWSGGTTYLRNPFENLLIGIARGLLIGDVRSLVGVLFTLAALMYLFAYYKEIGFSYWLIGMYSIFLPLAGPLTDLWSMPRYIAVVFPLYVILARTRSTAPRLGRITMSVFAVLQGALMVLWTTGVGIPL